MSLIWDITTVLGGPSSIARNWRIVTRLESDTPLTTVEGSPVPTQGPILSGRNGHLPAPLSGSRNNPFEEPVCEVRVKLDTGKVLRILSNDLDAPAAENRGTLQAALGLRAVLPLGQADPQNPPLS